MFNTIAGWLDGSLLQDGALWALQSIPGFPPIIQTVHILGIAVVMATVVLVNLRILGLAAPSQDLTEMTERSLPWLWMALLSNLISGSFFVFARPYRYFTNPVFGWKFVFLAIAVALTAYYHLRHRQQPGIWEQSDNKWTLRGIALLSLAAWILVAMAGRWIAYAEYIYYPA